MKLRIKGDSIRLRLTQSELQRFAEHGQVEERTRFGGGVELVYRLKRGAAAPGLAADFSRSELEVRVPPGMAREWCETDLVTLTGSQKVSADGELKITVEKDFACLTPREGEDESDNFPHPEAARGGKC